MASAGPHCARSSHCDRQEEALRNSQNTCGDVPPDNWDAHPSMDQARRPIVTEEAITVSGLMYPLSFHGGIEMKSRARQSPMKGDVHEGIRLEA
jgi:hypothetical protein